ncbi:hypothetical protein L7F22_032140 [Adiantum nelumboides]|nr:hypothetical protein [Adiantum nelumboides]
MPKERSSGGYQKVRDYAGRPYPTSDLESASLSGKSLGEDACAGRNDWEGAVCPVCMETPHNAVLLHCSSYEKGCRPYMCDTSYRHSNCFDQYLKAHSACQKTGDGQPGLIGQGGVAMGVGGADHENTAMGSLENAAGAQAMQTPGVGGTHRLSKCDLLGLTCPLCRGHVQDCKVVKPARDLLNTKVRVCAREACFFSGSYQELRVHARRDHPSSRPAEVDPARRRSWVRMEQQRELGDVLSVIQASMPHVTVSRDYAIDGEEDSVDNIERTFLSEEGHLLTVFLSFQVFGSVHSFIGGRPLPPFRGVMRRHRRSGSSRQGLWGEILQRSQSTENNDGAATNDYEIEGFLERGHRHQGR